MIASTLQIGKGGPDDYNGREVSDDLEASILAGGEGRRMGAITVHVPKPLLYLPGGTLLEHQLALLAELTLSRIFVVTKFKGQQMARVVGGLSGITTLRQGPPLTLLGAIATTLGSAREPCILIHGDNYFSHGIDYVAKAARSHFLDFHGQALFAVDSRLEADADEEALADSGCYVLSPELRPVVHELKESDQLRSLTHAVVEKAVGVGTVPLRGWRQNINELGDLLATNKHILEDWPSAFHCPGAEAGYHGPGSPFGGEGPVWVSPQAEVRDSALGSFTTVGPRSTVRGSNLDGVVVCPGAKVVNRDLSRAIVLPGRRGCLVLSADGDVDGGEEGYSEEQIAHLSPAAGKHGHTRQ